MKHLVLGTRGIAAFGLAGRMPSYRDFQEGVACSTWQAASTEELPLFLVERMCGGAWLALCGLLVSVASGDWKLLEDLHLCLVKRLPRWFLKNNRPTTYSGWSRGLCSSVRSS